MTWLSHNWRAWASQPSRVNGRFWFFLSIWRSDCHTYRNVVRDYKYSNSQQPCCVTVAARSTAEERKTHLCSRHKGAATTARQRLASETPEEQPTRLSCNCTGLACSNKGTKLGIMLPVKAHQQLYIQSWVTLPPKKMLSIHLVVYLWRQYSWYWCATWHFLLMWLLCMWHPVLF